MAGMRRLGLADKFVDRIRSDTRDASAAVSMFYLRGPQEIALDSCSAGADCGMERP
jgi:hypothetical protein